MSSMGLLAVAENNTPNAADWISTAATVMMFVIALCAYFLARGQLKEASLARQQSKDLDRERTQPYVVAFT